MIRMEVLEEIRKKIEKLEKETEELRMLRNDSDTCKYFRKKMRKTSEYERFD